MPKIFVSYRRSDAREEAVRVADEAANEFGPSAVFFDTDTMLPGDTFPTKIVTNIGASTHVLVIIGPDWLVKSPETGRPRLENPDDWVRNEVRMALDQGKTVIPVLVQNAEMPDPADVPPDLRALCDQNAIELRPDRFKGSLGILIDRLRDHSALAAAGIVFVSAALGGVLWFFIDQTNDFFRMTLRALQMISDTTTYTDAAPSTTSAVNCRLPQDQPITSNDLHCRVEFLLHAGVGGPVAQTVLAVFNAALYFGIVAYGALTAARGYTGVGADRIFPAIVLAAVCYIAAEIGLRAAHESIPFLKEDGVLTPMRYAASLAGFAVGLALPLRRRLNLTIVDVAAIGICAFVSVAMVEYLLHWMPLSAESLAVVPTDLTFYRQENAQDPGDLVLLYQLLERPPICLSKGAQTCTDMDFVIREVLRFSIAMAIACCVPGWGISIWRVLIIFAVLLVFGFCVVNMFAVAETHVLGPTRIFVDPGIPQAMIYALIAYLLARFRIRRPANAVG